MPARPVGSTTSHSRSMTSTRRSTGMRAALSSTLRGRRATMAWIDLGDQFIALSEGGPEVARPRAPRRTGRRRQGGAARRVARGGRARRRAGSLRVRDPSGNQLEIVDYRDVQFSKTPAVLRAMGLEGLQQTTQARGGAARQGASAEDRASFGRRPGGRCRRRLASLSAPAPPHRGSRRRRRRLELFFDLVYVLAITQLSHLLLTRLSWTSVGHMAFLLLVVWWAWIYTTWMVNWLDPGSTPVRMLIVVVALASLLMAAALPDAFTSHGFLFAAAYVALQVGRNLGGALLLRRDHPLGATFRRLLVWSVVAGVLWLAGALVPGSERLCAVGAGPGRRARGAAALVLDPGPRAGRDRRWTPDRGRALRRALPGLHHHRPRRVDRGHRSTAAQAGL